MERVPRTLCHHYLTYLGIKAFGEAQFTNLLRKPLEAVAHYACVEAVSLVTDSFEKELLVADADARVAYPEYYGGALQALEGLELSGSVAATLTGLGMSCWMTSLQRRRFYQCVGLWWTSRGAVFPVHEMYNWLLSCGENYFSDFMQLTRSLTDTTVQDVLGDFVAVPSPQRGPLGKLQDALHCGTLTAQGVRAYWSAWETKRTEVHRAIQLQDQQQLRLTARSWERSWADITAFLRDENVAVDAQLVARSTRIYDEIHGLVNSADDVRKKRLDSFVTNQKVHAEAAGGNNGTQRVRATEAHILGSETELQKTLVEVLLVYWEAKRYLPRRVQVLALVALLQGSVLANINTSEGKTYITGCVLAFKLYCGYRVIFATASADLAREAMEFNKDALALFSSDRLRVTAEDAETAKSSDGVYRAHVVYTTEANVRARVLRTLLDPTDERRFREWRGFAHWMLLDEADVPMVQSLTEAMYVGGPSLDARREVLAFAAIMSCAVNDDSEEAAWDVWQQRVRLVSRDPKDALLTRERFHRYWVSALGVQGVANDEDYVAVNGISVPYNTETGETLYTTSLMDGFSTMTCLKEGQRWEWETEAAMTVNPLTLLSEHFKNRVTAVTGTAGGYATQAIYTRVYGLAPVVIPPAFFSLFDELPHALYSNGAAYDAAIERSIRDAIGREQDVLVAVRTVAEADRLLWKIRARFALAPTTATTVHFQRYAREKMDLVPHLSAGVRHVFFMTFLGGRGLDVTPHERQPNGLHVVLCSAQHERATHQVLRRSARQYHPGSGQIICLLGTHTAAPENFTSDLMTREEFFAHQNKAIESERYRLQSLIACEIPQARLAQRLQVHVQDCVRRLRRKEGLYLCASVVVSHCFAKWVSLKREEIAQKGGDAACHGQLLQDLKRDVTDRFLSAAIDDVAGLSRLMRTTKERVIVANVLGGTLTDLPWCEKRVYEVFAGCPSNSSSGDGVCPYATSDLVHALEAASRCDIEALRTHVLAVCDCLSRWIAAQELFADDLNTMHREMSSGAVLDDAKCSGDLSSVHAATDFLRALYDHYLQLVGTDGVVSLSMFKNSGATFADTLEILEALVRHGFVSDAPCSAEAAVSWGAQYEAITQAVPQLVGKACPAQPKSTLAFLRFGLKSNVAMESLDVVFAGDTPLLPPLRVAKKIFHEHVQTYFEELEAKSIPHVSVAVGVLVGCVGRLRKDQVKRAPPVSAYVMFGGRIDSSVIHDWTCFGYQHVIDVEERENSSKNQAIIDEEARKKAEENSWWGFTKRFFKAVGRAIVDVGLNILANAVAPGLGFVLKNIVTPFIKSGFNLAKRYIETGKLEMKKFFAEGLSGAVMNCAAAGARRVCSWVSEKVGQSVIVQQMKGAFSAAKQNVAQLIHKGKAFVGWCADKLHMNNRLTQAVGRYGGRMLLRRGARAAVAQIEKVCTGDFNQDVKEVMREWLDGPLLEVLLTVKSQKPSQYERFLTQLVPHIMKGAESINLVESAWGGSSVLQTFDETLRTSCKCANDDTAALVYSFCDTKSFVNAACNTPKRAVKGVCEEYVSQSWAYATREFAVDTTKKVSASGVSPDARQSCVLSQFQQLVLTRTVQPIRNFVNGMATACIDSIRNAVNTIERQEESKRQEEKLKKELYARWASGVVQHDSSRLLLHDYVLGGGPTTYTAPTIDDLSLVFGGMSKPGFRLSAGSLPKGEGFFDRLIDMGEAIVDTMQSDVGKCVALGVFMLSVRDQALVERLMRMLDGETILPPLTLPDQPTLMETALIIFIIIYERFNVHRRLECSTFKEAALELCVAIVGALVSSSDSFDREVRGLRQGYGTFMHLKGLFQKAAEYSDKAYEEASWRQAAMQVKGKEVHQPTYQIYVDTPSELVVLAFRGSTTSLDYLCDCTSLSESFCGASAHCGFASVVKAFFDAPEGLRTLTKLTLEHPTYRVLITGHSMGGSVAILTGMRLLHEHVLEEKVLKRLFVVAIAGAPATTHQFTRTDNFFNFVNHMDCVPRTQLNSFDRLLKELLSDSDMTSAYAPELLQPENTFLLSENDVVRAASAAVTSTIYCAPSMLSDHSSKRYLSILNAM